MAELSPHLNANPIDRAFTYGVINRDLVLRTGEWFEIIITSGRRVEWSSGYLRVDALKDFDRTATFYRRKGEKVRYRLHRTKFLQGYPYQAAFPLYFQTPPPNLNGQVRVRIRGIAVQSSRAMRTSRSWSAGINKRYRWTYPPVSRATAQRPSPEFLTRPFLCTDERGGTGGYQSFPSIKPVAVLYRQWSGTRTPGYGSKRATALPDNPYSLVLYQYGNNRWYWYQSRIADGAFQLLIEPFTARLSVPNVPYLHIPGTENHAIKRLISNAQVGIQSNLALNIAQVGQLTNMIATNVTAMIQSVRFLRRGNIPAAVSALRAGRLDPRWKGPMGKPNPKRTVANNWLQLQYGWKPLLADIEGFLKVMNAQQGASDFVQRAQGSAKESRQVTVNLPTFGQYGDIGKTFFTYQTTVKYKVRFRMDNPLLSLFGQTGFTNPVNLAWELIPFSFVADWFLPIGSYLEALNAWDGATFLGGSKVLFTRLKTESTVAYSGPHKADASVNVLNHGIFSSDSVFFTREALSDFPSMTMPQPGKGISGVTRAANAIALLTQALK